MDHAHGISLRQLAQALEERGAAMEWPIAARLGVGLCSGLHSAYHRRDHHGRHFKRVHRELNPAKVMVGYDGEVELVDFGSAAAPSRVDLYGVGLAFYELLSGGAAAESELYSLMDGLPAPLATFRRDVPGPLCDAIDRCLDPDPHRRPQSAAELLEAFHAALVGLSAPVSEADVGRYVMRLLPPRDPLAPTVADGPPMPSDETELRPRVSGLLGDKALEGGGTQTLDDPPGTDEGAPTSVIRLQVKERSMRRGVPSFRISAGVAASLAMVLLLGQCLQASGPPHQLEPIENQRSGRPSELEPIEIQATVLPVRTPPSAEVVEARALPASSARRPAPEVTATRSVSAHPRTAKPARGSLSLRVTPWADVFIDGRSIGQTPLPTLSLPEGEHDVVLKNRDLKQQRRMKIRIRPGIELEFHVQLKDRAARP
jgi:hypothetical protein